MKIIKNTFYFLSVILIVVILFLPANSAYARPGGGHSYSDNTTSGSGSSSSGSNSDFNTSSGSATKGIIIFSLVIIVFLTFYFVEIKKKYGKFSGSLLLKDLKRKLLRGNNSLPRTNKNTIVSKPTFDIKKFKIELLDAMIQDFKKTDPNFSKILFLDFASLVFIKFYSWVYKPDFNNLSGYLPEGNIKGSNKDLYKTNFNEIVIGAINITDIKEVDNKQSIIVDIKANLSALNKNSNEKIRLIVTERWVFSRNKGVISPAPEKMRELSCPNCGVSLNFTDAGKCQNCNSVIKKGEKQWAVENHFVINQSSFKTNNLAYYTAEKGTNSPTLFHPEIKKQIEYFTKIHNLNLNEWSEKFKKEIVSEYFFKIYAAWSGNNINKVRNLISDKLFDKFIFWLSEYKKKGYTNKLENTIISEIQFVNIEVDKFYEVVTLRIFASSLDYTINKKGKRIGGSIKKSRKFSEYWTFIRRNGVEKDEFDLLTCPNCGAPADKIGQSGVCEYCKSKITNGDFSWVLAVITQDEVYRG